MRSLLVGEVEIGGQTLNAYSPARNLKAAVCRRRFLTIVLPLHVLGDWLHCTPELVVQFLGHAHGSRSRLRYCLHNA